MPSDLRDRGEEDRSVPSMLDLVRLSPRLIFPPGGVDLYRHIALLTDLSEGDELLDVACGTAVPLEYWVTEYDVHGSGVDPDPEAVERASARVRDRGLADRLQLQHGSPGDLPYRDEIFDVVVGEMGMTASVEPMTAIRELVRVAKPGAAVALVQLVWKAPVDPERRKVLSSHLGARPVMLVELKRMLKEAGVRDLHVEDWSDEETAFRRQVTKPFPDFAELFSLPEKLGILRRAWRRWGWQGVKTAVLREREVHRLLTRERIIDLDLVIGTRTGAGDRPAHEVGDPTPKRRAAGPRAPLPDGGKPGSGPKDGRSDGEDEAAGSDDAGRAGEASGDEGEDDGSASEVDEGERHEETAGLPLFGGPEEEKG